MAGASEKITAYEMRVRLAKNQRTAKSRERWLDMASQVNEYDCWSKKVCHDGVSIGDKVRFTDATIRGDSVHLSMKEAKAFAFGDKSMLVVYLGKLRKIRIQGGESCGK